MIKMNNKQQKCTFLNRHHQNVKKIWEKGCFSHGSQNFFPPTYMRLENGLNTSNICYKVSWNIWKHKFIILKSKFGPFLDGQKKFQRGCFSHAHPDDLKNVTDLGKIFQQKSKRNYAAKLSTKFSKDLCWKNVYKFQ